MDEREIEELLNLPDTGTFSFGSLLDEDIFQLNPEPRGENADPSGTPKDQIVTAIKAFEQCAFIVSIYYKAKYGVPMLPILKVDDDMIPTFQLHNE